MIYLKFYSEENQKTYYIEPGARFRQSCTLAEKPAWHIDIGEGWGCNKNNIKTKIKEKLFETYEFKEYKKQWEIIIPKYKISHIYAITNYSNPDIDLLIYERPQIMKNLGIYQLIRKL
jgi:hypothetical protein